MSEALEAEQKTNPQGDPITSVAAPKPAETTGTRKDPHAEAKRQMVVTPEYMFLEAPRAKEFITGSEAAKRPFGGLMWIWPLPTPLLRRAKRCSSSGCSTAKGT